MASTSDLEKGITIRKEGKLWFVIHSLFVSPGKGSAFYKTKLKEVQTGKVVDHTFKSGESIELIDTQRRNVQYLYPEGDRFVFMDEETYEQHPLPKEVVGEDLIPFLKEGESLVLFLADDEPINMAYAKPKKAFKVVETPPGVKGDTVSNAFKSATLETGAVVQVPLFIKPGEFIVVNVDTGEYVERYKASS